MKRLLLLSLSVLLTGNVAFGADTTASATIGDITNDNSNNATALSGGTFYNSSGGSVSQNFEASQPIPYLPGTPGVGATAPTLFNLKGYPAQALGATLLSKNMVYASCHDVALGTSGGTKIIFNASFPASRSANKDRNVYINLSGVGRGEVIGSLTVQSRKDKADEVDFSTLLFDARQYIAGIRDLKGYNVTLLSVPSTISIALGVDGKASGATLAPLASGLINGPMGVMAGLGSGFTSNEGVTAPTALIGCTFLVLVDSDQSQVVDLLSNRTSPDDSNGNGNGNNKKKYEAIQKDDAE
ncbi:hypothetical protein FGF66_12000 [Chlorobaculum thiosulfatiphilum]|jgi:hypothetical protein|uniref:Uncharacterized protein n=1 Tax=Chlorobaculum thiosulfatiphilum TaxID=115852 RepID=A0A5C4RZX6_CHLTI|nr:hypothetical protein [Chlorobaculum thiosulfatiphilum]TNJ36287.1 hypothetical protein FGF66_12000 [Chlorobaculum thiosulfatiphilum]